MSLAYAETETRPGRRRPPVVRATPFAHPLELWGGVECTVARIGEAYRDQLAETGHRDRDADLDLIASLGIRTLRYPAIWESTLPDGAGRCDWAWHDARFARLSDLGITPIAGLLHHGSGPSATNLLDPDLPAMLAAHAVRVAERTPLLRCYTPVNEPQTTARFSGLYGHWYPHRTDETAFLRMLVNECKAVALAMRAIRRIHADALLIQTEDIGKVFGTAALSEQASYENERRWLSLDLLHGRVDRSHPWRARLLGHGILADDLDLLADGEGTPDLIGINYYVTSDRYLDERLALYPSATHGGNGRMRYADVEAVRVAACAEVAGIRPRLLEVWRRYRRPIAVTEAHLGGSPEEQLRWLAEVWAAATTLRAEGVDVRAVTAWSLFGAVDWDSLLVRRDGHYEPGVFDARLSPPRPTELAGAVRSLAETGGFGHEALDTPGWWRRDDRFLDTR